MKKILFLFLLFILKTGFAQNIKITNFRASNSYQDSSYVLDNEAITLNFEKTHITIFYKDLADSVHAKYAFRLVGFEQNWI